MNFENINSKLPRAGLAGAGILLAGLVHPPLAHAGLGDFFGIATAVSAVSDVAWKIYAVKTFASMGPLILLIIAILSTIVAAWAMVRIGDSFSQTLRTTLRDGVVTRAEWGIILLQAGYTIPAIILLGLLTFGLKNMVHDSWEAMRNFVPPPIEQVPIVAKVRKT